MRIKETMKTQEGRGGQDVTYTRVRIIAATDPVPANAETVDDKTEVRDWTREEEK